MFIGVKMLVHDWYAIPNVWALGVVLAVLAAAIALSLLRPPPELEEPEYAPGDYEHSPAARALEQEAEAEEEQTPARR
jgi:hypothetical protein